MMLRRTLLEVVKTVFAAVIVAALLVGAMAFSYWGLSAIFLH